MKTVKALFTDPAAAERAAEALRKAGASREQITILSSEPLEEYVIGRPDRPTRMGWAAVLGGVIGGLSGYFLTAATQQAYPLVTGGMPVRTGWTNVIIIYELTMLGVILATAFTLVLSAPLLRWKPAAYDPEISDGKILIAVEDAAEDRLERFETILRAESGRGG